MKYKFSNIVGVVILFTGFILTYFAIHLFGLTFIPLSTSLSIYFFGGIVGFLLFRKKFSGIYKSKTLNFVTSIICLVGSCGGIVNFIFLALNFYLADKEPVKENFIIIKPGSLPKGGKGHCNQPYIIIERSGLEKQLIFKCNLSNKISSIKSVDLTLNKGKLGYYIIRDTPLMIE